MDRDVPHYGQTVPEGCENCFIEIPPGVEREDVSVEDIVEDEGLLVSSFDSDLLVPAANNYRAGNIAHFLQNWEYLTSDKEIISAIKYRLKLIYHYLHYLPLSPVTPSNIALARGNPWPLRRR